MEFKLLEREKYEYFELHYTYFTDERFEAIYSESKDGFKLEFVRRRLKERFTRSCYDTFYQPYWFNPQAYALCDNGTVKAYFEIDREEWNNRLRITQLLVDEKYRGEGIGSIVVDFVRRMAVEEEYRMVIVETQSCNTRAIDFYLKNGFKFIGSNIMFYSNDDIAEEEVMIEMAIVL